MRFMLLIAGSVVGLALGDWIMKQFEKRMNGIKSTKESTDSEECKKEAERKNENVKEGETFEEHGSED